MPPTVVSSPVCLVIAISTVSSAAASTWGRRSPLPSDLLWGPSLSHAVLPQIKRLTTYGSLLPFYPSAAVVRARDALCLLPRWLSKIWLPSAASYFGVLRGCDISTNPGFISFCFCIRLPNGLRDHRCAPGKQRASVKDLWTSAQLWNHFKGDSRMLF